MKKISINSLIKCGFLTLFVFVLGIGNAKAIEKEYENYYGIAISDEEYLNLLNLGFSEDQIYYMDRDTYDINKDIEAVLLSTQTHYYKTVTNNITGQTITYEITYQEMMNELNSGSQNAPMGTVTTGYKTMVSTISSISGGYRYMNTLNWTTIPSVRSYDVIGIGINNVGGQYISSSIYFGYAYGYSSGSVVTSSVYYNQKKVSTGGSTVYKLPDGNIVSLSASIYYNVAKASGAGTLYNVGMCGDYAHATSNVTSTQAANHSITFSGISFGGTVGNYYDSIPCAYSYVGTW